MLNTIIQATENFCIHQIRLPHTIHEALPKTRTLIAYIDIKMDSGPTHRVYLSASESFIQRVAKIFIEEKKSDEETLIDMLLETANLIVGSAKVLAEESENTFTIKTPHFEKIGEFTYEWDALKVIQIEDDTLTVAMKELD